MKQIRFKYKRKQHTIHCIGEKEATSILSEEEETLIKSKSENKRSTGMCLAIDRVRIENPDYILWGFKIEDYENK